MAISYRDIYDDTLIKLGNAQLPAVGYTNSPAWDWLENLYPKAVSQVISEAMFDPQCLSTRSILTQDSSSPAFGFLYQYGLPYDCVKVREMYPAEYPFKIEGRYLLTDVDNTDLDPGVGIRYSKGLTCVTTPPDWATATSYYVGDFVIESSTTYLCIVSHTSGTFATDLSGGDWEASEYRYLTDLEPFFIEAVTCKLAYLLSYKINQSQNFKQGLLQEYQYALMMAKQSNSENGSIEGEEGSTEWIDTGR